VGSIAAVVPTAIDGAVCIAARSAVATGA
jgi:hypothetical protein